MGLGFVGGGGGELYSRRGAAGLILAAGTIGWPGGCQAAALVGGEDDGKIAKTPLRGVGLREGLLLGRLGRSAREREEGRKWAEPRGREREGVSLFFFFSFF
jgi:hypothetical protein